MKREFIYGLLMICAGLAGVVKSASAEPLDVKPGLWETTMHTQGRGQMPMSPAEMQNMSPQQRAAIAEMEARNKQPRTTVVNSCLTRQELDKDENAFLPGESGMTCNGKLSRHTSTSMAGTRHCTNGSSQQTEDFEFEVQDRGHVTGRLNVTISNGTKTMSVKGNMSSRWIGAACGKTP